MTRTAFLSAVTGVALVVSGAALSGCRDFFAKTCDTCGVIESVSTHVEQGRANPAGTIAGAIIGGVVGHQFGSGKGNDAATVGGAVGGALVGNQIAKDRAKYTVYDLAIRMEKGGVRHLTVSSLGGLRTGDKVEIRDGRVVPMEVASRN